MGDTGNVVRFAKPGCLIFFAVGDYTESDSAAFHSVDPDQEFLRRDAGCVGEHGIVKIQHQKVNSPLKQKLRRQVGQLLKNYLRQQGKGHERSTTFILSLGAVSYLKVL